MHKWQNIQQETTYILLLYWFFRTVSNSKQAIVAVIAKLLHMTSLSIKQLFWTKQFIIGFHI